MLTNLDSALGHPGPQMALPGVSPIPFAAPALAPAAADCCLLSAVLPLIGTSEQPALRARRTCQCPRDAATPVAEERKYRVEREGKSQR